MGRTIWAGIVLAAVAQWGVVTDHLLVAALAGTSSFCVWAALVLDAIFSKRLKVYGFHGKLEKDTKIKAHRGQFVTIHPARGDLQLTELRGEQRRIIFEELGLKDELIEINEKKKGP